jgi:hypothetical protein
MVGKASIETTARSGEFLMTGTSERRMAAMTAVGLMSRVVVRAAQPAGAALCYHVEDEPNVVEGPVRDFQAGERQVGLNCRKSAQPAARVYSFF